MLTRVYGTSGRWLFVSGAVCFVAVGVLRTTVLTDPRAAGTSLFVVPVVLWALIEGYWWGAIGAALASIATVAILGTDDMDLVTLDVLAPRIVMFFVVGLVVCQQSATVRRLARRLEGHRLATEVNDEVLQLLVLAKYELEGRGWRSESLDGALEGTRRIVTERLGAEVRSGDLRLPSASGRPPGQP